MITPITGETDWMSHVLDVPLWTPGDAPMVVVVPHPDDETLAVGGLIANQCLQGLEVTVLAVTDGEHAYADNEGLADTRRREQEEALARLGVSRQQTIRLGLTDSGVSRQEALLRAKLQPWVTARTQVVAPWRGDFHPDHEACARAAEFVARSAGATLISYLFWTWHRGTVATVDGLMLKKFVLNEAIRTTKQEALACHRSQLGHAPEPEILPEDLLWPARMPFEIFAL